MAVSLPVASKPAMGDSGAVSSTTYWIILLCIVLFSVANIIVTYVCTLLKPPTRGVCDSYCNCTPIVVNKICLKQKGTHCVFLLCLWDRASLCPPFEGRPLEIPHLHSNMIDNHSLMLDIWFCERVLCYDVNLWGGCPLVWTYIMFVSVGYVYHASGCAKVS